MVEKELKAVFGKRVQGGQSLLLGTRKGVSHTRSQDELVSWDYSGSQREGFVGF